MNDKWPKTATEICQATVDARRDLLARAFSMKKEIADDSWKHVMLSTKACKIIQLIEDLVDELMK